MLFLILIYVLLTAVYFYDFTLKNIKQLLEYEIKLYDVSDKEFDAVVFVSSFVLGPIFSPLIFLVNLF